MMAATDRLEADLKEKSSRKINETSDPVEKLRLKCLARGANGIKGLAR